ncbi:MAG: aspartate aminotransferase family protein [Terriglobales bacterium]|jgi:acetylornithine aminotransferase/acetylornithine/N-succinyldiaminopimelate aminotransferase
MSLASVSRMEAKLLLPTYERQPILFVRGRGVYLWDSQGKRYLDFLSGIGVNALGHNHPTIQAAIKRQAGRLIHVSNLFFHEYQAELARLLTQVSGLDRAFFCNSGTEAWEGALKLARAFAQMNNTNGHKPKWRILAMDNSFHGRTFGALATTGQPKYRAPFVPLLPGVSFVKFNDLDDLQRKFDSSVCAVCIETIQGEGGICPVNQEFLEFASRLTKQSGALLVLDEIQCGLGRTGRHFAYQHYGVLPDVVTVAKPLACGLPLGAILTTERVARCMHPGMHGTTFGGGPLACAVAIEFLREEKKLLNHVRALGKYFHAALEALDKKHKSIHDVRGAGLMQAVELESSELAKAVTKRLLQEGIIINRTHETVLRFLPPYVIQKRHVDQVVKALDAALYKNEELTHKNTNNKEKIASPRPKEVHAHA